MSSREFSEWIAYYRTQPFGEAREDFRMGQICAVSAAPHVKSGYKPPAWTDFVPERANESRGDAKTILIAWAKAHEGK